MTVSLRIAFMGSPDFAVPVLAALSDAGHEIACVYSQPPRPAGRGKKLRPTPVHAWAEARGLEVRTPRSLKKAPEQEAFEAFLQRLRDAKDKAEFDQFMDDRAAKARGTEEEPRADA